MSKMLTIEYLANHKRPDQDHYLEVGKLLSDAIIDDAIAEVRLNGDSELITLNPTIQVTANVAAGCVQVTYTRSDGTTLTFHRPT